ncbi:MAG TPA: PEP-CTERM sorting domain-containing protein [Burkholderiaceae bacterium]|nr:PEP-CTERM sorting domain-containing protein [Burkholderiaceae bacterium]
MKFVKTLLAAAALVASVGANAQSFTTGVGPGSYAAPSPSDVSPPGSFSIQSTSVPNLYLAPLGDSSTFLVVNPGFTATIDLHGVTSFSFLWGSPDPSNAVSFNGGAFMTGTAILGALANSSNANTQWITFTADAASGPLNTMSIKTGQIAFEMAVAAPVPEPETYALMLAGLGAMAFVARRRKSS